MASERPIAVIAALVGNSIIAVGKLVAGLIANSASMLAEAAHSFSDVGNQILLLFGIRRSKKPPSERFPFGTGRTQYFWPFMVAVLLFGVAGAFSLFEGIEKFRHPHELRDIRLSLAVLTGAFIIEGFTVYVAVRQAVKEAKEEGSNNVREWLQDNRDASLLTVIVEDSLALVSLPIAGAALLASSMTGDARYDAAGSVLIGLMLMGFAAFLGDQVRSLLIGRGVSKRNANQIHAISQQIPGLGGLKSLQTMHLGPDQVLVGAEVFVDGKLGAKSINERLNDLEAQIKATVPDVQFVFLEPHVED